MVKPIEKLRWLCGSFAMIFFAKLCEDGDGKILMVPLQAEKYYLKKIVFLP